MATKVFTTIAGPCPFGEGHGIDTEGCRRCGHYWRVGTGLFFWCNHPAGQSPATIERKAPEMVQVKRKRGRPAGKTAKKAANRSKTKK